MAASTDVTETLLCSYFSLKADYFRTAATRPLPQRVQIGPLLSQDIFPTMSEDNICKDNSFLEKHIEGQRKFECQLCHRTVNSKQSIMRHLFQQHSLSPVKPKNNLHQLKGYPVPRSTMYRWKSSKHLPFSEKAVGDCSSVTEDKVPTGDPVGTGDPVDTRDPVDTGDHDIVDTDLISPETDDCASEQFSSSDNYLSERSDTSSYLSSSASRTSASENETSDNEESTKSTETNALKLLACFKKHNVTSSGCKDILKTIRDIMPDIANKSMLHYGQILSHVPATVYNEFNYCSKCEHILPEGNQCETEGCGGVVKSFMTANVKELLRNLLKAPGIMEDIRKYKECVDENADSNILTDIQDAEMYKERMSNRISSSETIHLTGVLNTDGVNLYSSSKVEIWPVFLAINELPPASRFARENLILIGLWQGKGKPPFKIFFEFVSQEINMLTQNGLEVEIEGESVTVYLTVLCVTLDLPAKAGVLNMTLFNGSQACISCEEPGTVVRQGRGHSRSYPYRTPDTRFSSRSHANVLQLMNSSSDSNRQKGFKGLSGLTFLQEFDLVNGCVPDYMHCVLLGIVKTIMGKWFSPTQSGNDYFIGRHLKQISEKLLKIKPPYYIERLPRDLEKHYAHFKATEIQAFLLYYAVPCLHGILGDKYLQHFALLSEAIFILLGDKIDAACLERSETLLEKFYSQFAELYGAGSCGLNVHNACIHLPACVKKLGPIWCWSCFAFEDGNAMILQSVHGTGDVVKQALRNQEISMYMRSLDVKVGNSNRLKVTYKAENCSIIGSLKQFNNQVPLHLVQALNVENRASLRKAQRVIVNGVKFYSAEYSRMKRRNCHAVLHSEGHFGLIQYFVLVLHTNMAYAVMNEMNSCDSWLNRYEAAKHLKPVEITNSVKVVAVENLKNALVFIDLESASEAIIVDTPNMHGHAIFK